MKHFLNIIIIIVLFLRGIKGAERDEKFDIPGFNKPYDILELIDKNVIVPGRVSPSG